MCRHGALRCSRYTMNVLTLFQQFFQPAEVMGLEPSFNFSGAVRDDCLNCPDKCEAHFSLTPDAVIDALNLSCFQRNSPRSPWQH